jgi:hypothetical protein
MTAQITSWRPMAEAMSKAVQASSQFIPGHFAVLKHSNQAFVAGMQDFTRLYVAAAQGLVQQAVDGTKAVAGAKTLQDVLAIQTDISRAAVERMISEGTKLQYAAQVMAQQAYAPLAQQATSVAGQAKLPQAA